jgi:hypothetical protein
MDSNDRIINRLERVYSLYGAGDNVDALVSFGGHAYRQDIRQGAYRFINSHLKGDARPVTDSEVDLVSEGNKPGPYPIPPRDLRVFPTDADLPADQLNTKIDELFVPMAKLDPPATGQYDAWRKDLLAKLRATTFNYFPEQVDAAKTAGESNGWTRVTSEDGIEFRIRLDDARPGGGRGGAPGEPLLIVLNEDDAGKTPDWVDRVAAPSQQVILCEPRGVGGTRWTVKDPPNYVARAHVLLGRTVDSGRAWDVIAAARAIASAKLFPVGGGNSAAGGLVGAQLRRVHLAARGPAAVLAAYAAALDDSIAGVTLIAPNITHMDATAPQFLNVLRTADIPDVLGTIAPRPLTILDPKPAGAFGKTKAIYTAAGAADKLTIK